ncbi:MAG: glycosyltransferase family 4 protein [Chthonomonadales bacterium]|nr:glycosyltransferase family 4 protein [Chthonomonadales bacterium]
MTDDGAIRFSVLQVLRPAAGGMLRHVADVCDGMRARGIACTVAGPTVHLPTWADRISVAVDAPIRGSFHPAGDLIAIARVARAARSHGVIHAHGLRAAWIGGWAACLSRTPMVMTAHNVPGRLTASRRWALKRSVLAARAVVAVSGAVADRLVHLGVPAQKVTVVPNGVRVPASRPAQQRGDLGLSPDRFVVMGAGRLAPEKGFDVLIEAFGRLRHTSIAADLVLCGAGPERDRLLAQAAATGLTDHVRLVGHVPELAAWLAVADAVAVPSRMEGQGLVALESMALGVAVVASGVGGLPEVIEDGLTGLLVPPEDPVALADALIRLAQDPVLRTRLGEAGRERVHAHFSLDAMLDRLESLYETTRKSLQGNVPPAG